MLLFSSCEKITSLLPPGGDLSLLFLYVYRHDAVDILFYQLTLALTILEEGYTALLEHSVRRILPQSSLPVYFPR